jgi:hypothetical protein
VALSDIYTPEAVARAMEDAFVYEAFSSDYIANLVEQRTRFTPEASALHLTRRGDLLDGSRAPRLSACTAPPHSRKHPTQRRNTLMAEPNNLQVPPAGLGALGPHLT